MYLNKAAIGAYKYTNIFIISFVGFTTFIGFWMFIFSFSAASKDHTAAMFLFNVMNVGATGAGVWVIIWRINSQRRISRARLYNSLFEEDHDGILTYESIASMLGIPVSRAVSELMWYYEKNILRNLTLGRTAVRVDLMAPNNEFLTVICPTCGAHVNLRKGGGGRCDHCGTFMRAKEV